MSDRHFLHHREKESRKIKSGSVADDFQASAISLALNLSIQIERTEEEISVLVSKAALGLRGDNQMAHFAGRLFSRADVSTVDGRFHFSRTQEFCQVPGAGFSRATDKSLDAWAEKQLTFRQLGQEKCVLRK